VIGRIVVDLLQVYLIVLFVRILLTWVPVDPWSRFNKVIGWLGAITDPLLRPLRRWIPPLRIGSAMLDLSPIVLIVVVEVLIGVLGGSRYLI
jgi:YggT family protein